MKLSWITMTGTHSLKKSWLIKISHQFRPHRSQSRLRTDRINQLRSQSRPNKVTCEVPLVIDLAMHLASITLTKQLAESWTFRVQYEQRFVWVLNRYSCFSFSLVFLCFDMRWIAHEGQGCRLSFAMIVEKNSFKRLNSFYNLRTVITFKEISLSDWWNIIKMSS